MFDPHDPSPTPFEIPVCVCCRRELHGDDFGRRACQRCQDRMTDRLNQVEHDYLELPQHLQRGSRIPDSGGRCGASVAALPLRLDVLALVGPGGIVAELQAVEDDWRRARRLTVQTWRGSAEQTLPKVCRFLRGHLPWACGAYEDVAELDTLLARIVGQLAAVVSGERRRTIPVVCGAVYGDGALCDGVIRVGAHTLRTVCADCGAEWTRDHLVAMAAGLGEAA
jgi:hypothetical protein